MMKNPSKARFYEAELQNFLEKRKKIWMSASSEVKTGVGLFKKLACIDVFKNNSRFQVPVTV